MTARCPRCHALGPALVVEDDRAVLLDLILRSPDGILVGIDVLGRHLLRRVLVFVQLVRIPIELRRLVEYADLERRVQLVEDLRVCGDRLNCLFAVRSQRLFRREDR